MQNIVTFFHLNYVLSFQTFLVKNIQYPLILWTYIFLTRGNIIIVTILINFISFVFACILWRPTYIVLCFWFEFISLVYPMLPVSLDCQFLIAPSVFSNVYLNPTVLELNFWNNCSCFTSAGFELTPLTTRSTLCEAPYTTRPHRYSLY